jgi:manganese transport protein
VLEGRSNRRGFARILPFIGPAFIACIAYIDPGNFATNIAGGAKYGYLLIWAIVMSNLMAMLIQSLSAKLGIATGHNLPEVCREQFPRPVVFILWVLAEVVAMATDLAEFLGAALGFNLLFHIPLFLAALLTAVCTFLILALERYGFRPLEAVISVMVGVIALCYILETILGKPDFGAAAQALFPPRLEGTESLMLAVGILGATVMPHVIYLHSSLTQHRIRAKTDQEARRLFRFEVIDVVIAMSIAGFVNASMLMMAAATFHAAGLTDIDAIEDAHKTLEPLLGGAAPVIFAISLLVSGLSSSTVGTMAGQVMMQGFLQRYIPIWVRRLVTMLPALIVIALQFDPSSTLILSQVVLSFGIPFALVPLVIFTVRRDIMGALVNRLGTTVAISAVAVIIIGLNVFLLYQTFIGG